jgi:hypothetical protein
VLDLLFEPTDESLGLMEGEDLAASGIRLKEAGESCLHAGALV